MNEADHIELKLEHPEKGIVIVRPIGEIDLSCAVSLRQQLREVQNASPDRMIVDLQDVPYMDSSGVATLIEAMQVARRSNRKLVLCSLQDKVRSVFEIAKLDTVFTIADNADTARTV